MAGSSSLPAPGGRPLSGPRGNEPLDAAIEPAPRSLVLGGEVVEVAHEGERLDLGAGLCRQVARQVAQSEDPSLRAVQKAQRLDQRPQCPGLVEHQCIDRAAAQALLRHQVLEHGEGRSQRRHARARLRQVVRGIEARLDQDAAPVEPGPAAAVQLDLAKEQRVAAADEDEVDDEELAGVAQAVELLRIACRGADSWRNVTGESAWSADSTCANVASIASSATTATASTSDRSSTASKAALPPSHAASTASLRSSACRSAAMTSVRVNSFMDEEYGSRVQLDPGAGESLRCRRRCGSRR